MGWNNLLGCWFDQQNTLDIISKLKSSREFLQLKLNNNTSKIEVIFEYALYMYKKNNMKFCYERKKSIWKTVLGPKLLYFVFCSSIYSKIHLIFRILNVLCLIY